MTKKIELSLIIEKELNINKEKIREVVFSNIHNFKEERITGFDFKYLNTNLSTLISVHLPEGLDSHPFVPAIRFIRIFDNVFSHENIVKYTNNPSEIANIYHAIIQSIIVELNNIPEMIKMNSFFKARYIFSNILYILFSENDKKNLSNHFENNEYEMNFSSPQITTIKEFEEDVIFNLAEAFKWNRIFPLGENYCIPLYPMIKFDKRPDAFHYTWNFLKLFLDKKKLKTKKFFDGDISIKSKWNKFPVYTLKKCVKILEMSELQSNINKITNKCLFVCVTHSIVFLLHCIERMRIEKI